MKEVKTPKRPLIYYYGIVLLIILLFNLLVTPCSPTARWWRWTTAPSWT